MWMRDTAEDIPRELLEKELATKDKVEVVEEDKEEKKKKKKEISEPETPSKEDGNFSVLVFQFHDIFFQQQLLQQHMLMVNITLALHVILTQPKPKNKQS